MTGLATAVVSILALSGLGWFATSALRRPLCPVCLGVGGTWAWMLAARFAGYAVDATILAVLLGASVVGAAYQLERRLGPGRSPLLWKGLFIPVGIVAAHALVAERWSLAAAALLVLVSLAAYFRSPRQHVQADAAAVSELEDKLKGCC